MRFALLSFILISFSVFLGGCGASLPVKEDISAGTGVLAIPKSYKSEVPWPNGWAREVEILDDSGQPFGKPIRLHTVSGRQLVFVKNLPLGNYTIKRIRLVQVNSNSIGSGKKPFRRFGVFQNFRIEEGAVTVFPWVFHTDHKRLPSGSRSRAIFVPKKLIDEELTAFKKVMSKSKNIEQWDVLWP